MVEAEIVHDRAGLRDRLARCVETAGEPLEAADPDQAVRLDPPVRRLVQDRAAAGEGRLDVLRSPESVGDDVSPSAGSAAGGSAAGAGDARLGPNQTVPAQPSSGVVSCGPFMAQCPPG